METRVQHQAPGSRSQTPWIVRRKQPAATRVRLFCFPYAGAGSLAYHSWPDELPDDIEICAVQLPGRENRLREPALNDLTLLTDQLVDALSPHLEGDFAFFGHSFGALVAFALARELRRRALPLPRVLFASGRQAPSFQSQRTPLSVLEGDDFVRELCKRYDGIPRRILDEPDLLALIVPTLRADLQITEGYTYQEEAPLPVRICAFGGTEDPGVAEAALRAWQKESGLDFELHVFPGGHFFINQARAQVLRAVRDALAAEPGPA